MLMDGVAASVADFTGKAAPDSDLVLLTLEYKRGNRELARLTLSPDMGQARRLQEFLREQMEANGIAGKDYAESICLFARTQEQFTFRKTRTPCAKAREQC